jgi:hypothetical protein
MTKENIIEETTSQVYLSFCNLPPSVGRLDVAELQVVHGCPELVHSKLYLPGLKHAEIGLQKTLHDIYFNFLFTRAAATQ